MVISANAASASRSIRPDARSANNHVALAAFLAILLGLATAARAASPTSVISDCSEDGVLNGNYSQSELDRALEQLPSDLDEYTDCRSVIRRAQLGSAGDKRTAAARRRDRRAGRRGLAAHRRGAARSPRRPARATPVRIGGAGVRPGASAQPFDSAGFGGDLPPLVLIVLLRCGLRPCLAAVAALRRAPRRWAARRIGEGVKRGISRFRR